MPKQKRQKTKYPGVYFVEGTSVANGKPERIYYIIYRKNGKLIEEKAGRQFQDDMTPSRAASLRSQRIDGTQLSNKALREAERRKKKEAKWTIDRLWAEYESQKPDSKSIRTDSGRYKNYLREQFGHKEPCELVQLDVDRLRINLLKQKKPQTVKHILMLLQRIINFGAKKSLCEAIKFKIEIPRVNNIKMEDLNPEQLTRLIEAIDQDSNTQAANLMKMALFTGMRRGELFRLKWEDIDFDRGFILIRGPKGGIDQKIPLNSAVRALLENHPRIDSPFIFPGRGGKQRTDIKKQVNRIKEHAGLPKDFRALHGLRHVYASMLASSGQVDMYTLQKLLTHKSPQMTQRYAHLRDETLKRAADLAGNLINLSLAGKSDKQSAENK